jgi:hypothetical protein
MNTTKGSPQGTSRTTAAVVGVLFIIGTVSGLLMFPFITILNTPDHLSTIATHEGQMIIATLLKFVMGVACAGIGLALYPILKKYNEGLAMGAAGFRIIEGVIGIVGAVGYVALLALSQEFVKAGAPAFSFYQTADVLINTTASWLRDVAVLLTWCIGALMYYSIFYQHKLVPRWLTIWGLVGITLTSISCMLVMFHLIPTAGTIQVILSLPILVQELVMAVWLIVKGFNPPAISSPTAKTATKELLSAA